MKNKIAVLWLLIGLAAIGSSRAAGENKPLPRLRAGERYLYDEHNRVALLRGVNVLMDGTGYGEEDARAIKELGFNFIRIGVLWDRAEPEPGKYDQKYLESVLGFMQAAEQQGIYVMPEIHQYVWGSPGSGIPAWLLSKPVKSAGDIFGMFRESSRFWKEPKLQDRMLGFWKYLQFNFKPYHNIFGYNVLNEPVSPKCFISGCFERDLVPFYDRAANALRESDPSAVIVFDPCTFAVMFPTDTTRFPRGNAVYSTHPYFAHFFLGSSGKLLMEREPPEEVRFKYQRYYAESQRMHAPLLIGEFGALPEYPFTRKWLDENFKMQDQLFLSWTIWVYSPKGKGWSIVDENRRLIPYFSAAQRPYPRFTAGVPDQLEYQPGHSFLYIYQPSPEITALTEISIPREMMEKAEVKVTNAQWKYDSQEQLMILENDPGNKEVRLEIRF